MAHVDALIADGDSWPSDQLEDLIFGLATEAALADFATVPKARREGDRPALPIGGMSESAFRYGAILA